MSSEKASKSSKNIITIPKVDKNLEEKGALTFTLSNTNVSVANSIRRTIMADIPTVVMNKNIKFTKNTTNLNNEILIQRLKSIPVFLKPDSKLDDIEISLDLKNDTDSIRYVTTNDFELTIKSSGKKLIQSDKNKIFPPHPISKQYILFARLKPLVSKEIDGEVLSFTASFDVATAKEHGGFNVACTCAYGNTPDPILSNERWNDFVDEQQEKGTSEKDIDKYEKDWENHQKYRYFVDNSFDFTIETIGVFKNNELVTLACENIIKRLQKIIKQCNDDTIPIQKNVIAMKNSFDIELIDEDYTIGKVIEYVLYQKHFENDKILSYVGFCKFHPHDISSYIRIAFTNETNANKVNICNIVKASCNDAINLVYKNIITSFK